MEEHTIENRAVTYARTSGNSQDKKLSQAGQDRVMFAYAADMQLHIDKSFHEVGSGLDTAGRAEFLAAIEYVLDPKNNISHIIFHDLSRFSRGTSDPYTYLKMLDEKDIIVHAADDRTNSDDDNDLLWGVKFVLNNQQSKDISQFTMRGLNESVEMGNDISTVVAYGYEKYYFEDNGKLRPRWRPHPVHAKHILTMFEMRAAGRLPSAIRDYLNEQEIPTPRGGLWKTGTIIQMLRSLTYIGYSQVGKKSKSKFPRHRRRRKLVQNPNAHEPLVSHELFYKVQAIMPKISRAESKPPRSKSDSNPSPNPLTDAVKCAKCNANMVVANSTRKDSKTGKKLTCSTKKNAGIRYCATQDVDLDDFLKVVGGSLKARLSTPAIMQDQLDIIIKKSGGQAEEEKKRQAEIEKRSKEIDRQKENLMKALREAQEEYPENVSDFNRSLSDLNKEKAKLGQQKLEIDEETAELMAFLTDPEGLEEAMMEIGTEIDAEDLAGTAKFLQTFVNKVVVSDDDATMYYSLLLPSTVKTEDGYKTSTPLKRGSRSILLEYSGPVAP